MNIGVLGTGQVGATIGAKMVELGHQVMMGSRTKNNEKGMAFAATFHNNGHLETFKETAEFGEIIFNCTSGIGSMDALKLCGADKLRGKILIDVANPLDFSKGMPPTLSIVNTTSLGEEIQKAYPETHVVKALNTMWCGIMVNPKLVNDGDHQTFICGNDGSAKKRVSEILTSFGWLESNILDLGDITKSRCTEMYLPLWLSIYGATKNGTFNIKIVR